MKQFYNTVLVTLLLAETVLACDGCVVIWASPVWGLLLLICGAFAWKRTRELGSLPRRLSLLILSFFGGFFATLVLSGLTHVLIGFISFGPAALLTAHLLSGKAGSRGLR